MKDLLFGKTLPELEEIARDYGLKPFHARQMSRWLYRSNIFSVAEMTDIPLTVRGMLSENYDFGLKSFEKVSVSSDGTKKYLYPTLHGRYIETAFIPERERATLCVSTQVGCRMGCLFCMTGRQGFQGNLTAGEILNQYRSLPEKDQITNIVYMGMGESFDNLDNVLKSLEIFTSEWGYAMSPRRITVSTIGVIPGMKEFLDKSKCHLAVSLHSPFEEERRELLPIGRLYSLQEVLEVIHSFDFGRQRRISFEYIMFKGLNDTPRHVKELARILNKIRCRINLIRYHPIPDSPLEPTDDKTIEHFQNALKAKGIITTLRASRGLDIAAACGLLSTQDRIFV